MAVSPKANIKSIAREKSTKTTAKTATATTPASTQTTQVSGKPDRASFDAEQNKLKTEIDALQIKFVIPIPYFHTEYSDL
jgi:hypothetical protein